MNVRRNTLLLSAALAANSGMLQLNAAVASKTLVLAIGVKGLVGLGPAIPLAAGARDRPGAVRHGVRRAARPARLQPWSSACSSTASAGPARSPAA